MIKTSDFYTKLFFILSSILILVFPKGFSVYFDGLPWTSFAEIILLCSILPILFFYRKEFYYKKFILLCIVFLNILSLILIFSPKTGISHKQYFVDDDNFIKTYDTIWNKKVSSIQKKNWSKKNNFPIDWTTRHPLNRDEDNNFKYFKNYDEFTNLELIYNSKFYLL